MLEELMAYSPYELDKEQKSQIFLQRMNTLTHLHYENCEEYRRICDLLFVGNREAEKVEDVPFLPVSLFKQRELRSVSPDDIVKTMTSSGTSGQQVSKIFLNRETAANQQKVLAKIVSDFTGSSRMPMIILDCPSVIKNRALFSARGAGILGFSIFASKKFFAFDDEMNLNYDGLKEFLEIHKGKTILLFGFTYMVWQYFYKALKQAKQFVPLVNAILIHGGGWKKLIHESVSKDEFKEGLREVCGIQKIHDYYGMVEQTGCIYMECEHGHLHVSNYSDVLIRNMEDFSLCRMGEPGAIQVMSAIPESYPGFSILTEDIGCIRGEDDCPCGRKGKYIEIQGRMKNVEIRGCSDTFEL